VLSEAELIVKQLDFLPADKMRLAPIFVQKFISIQPLSQDEYRHIKIIDKLQKIAVVFTKNSSRNKQRALSLSLILTYCQVWDSLMDLHGAPAMPPDTIKLSFEILQSVYKLMLMYCVNTDSYT
jgi:hypothetical protein